MNGYFSRKYSLASLSGILYSIATRPQYNSCDNIFSTSFFVNSSTTSFFSPERYFRNPRPFSFSAKLSKLYSPVEYNSKQFMTASFIRWFVSISIRVYFHLPFRTYHLGTCQEIVPFSRMALSRFMTPPRDFSILSKTASFIASASAFFPDSTEQSKPSRIEYTLTTFPTTYFFSTSHSSKFLAKREAM